MKKIEAMVISSVRPEPTTAGNIILYRLLAENGIIQYETFGMELQKLHIYNLCRRIFGRLSKTRFSRLANDYFIWHKGRWLDPYLPENVETKKLVITMAHGDACYAALRYAKKKNIPLVTLFDDWYPDMVDSHQYFKEYHENIFRQLYTKSDLVFCVCPGMKNELGNHKASYVLNRIPGNIKKYNYIRSSENEFRILYFGNVWDYGPMLQKLLESASISNRLKFEVRGNNPKWTDEFIKVMEKSNNWLKYSPREEFEKWLFSADAFLITMLFDEKYKRRMITSFPSKIAECVQVGKPVIIWGPEYCSAVQWANKNVKALCVTSPDPICLIREIERLANDRDEQKRLAEQSRLSAENEFNRKKIYEQFNNCLVNLLEEYENEK